MLSSVLLLLVCQGLIASENPGTDDYLYARKLFEERYYDLAADQLERCLRDFPSLTDADEAQFMLGEAYLRSGDPDRARAAFLRTVIVYPESPHAPEALFKVGESLESAGRNREAAQAFERVQGFYSGSNLAPRAMGKAASLFTLAGDTLHADDLTNQLIEKYPDSPFSSISRLELANRLIEQGDYRAAIQYLNWVATRAGMDSLAAEAWVNLGRLYKRRFDLSSAMEAYQTCIDRFPSLIPAAKARLELAGIENLRGSQDEARRIVAPLLASSISEFRLKALVVCGDAEYLRTNYEDALAFYDTAAAGSHEAMLKAAWTTELLGRRKSALDRYIKLAGAPGSIGVSAKIRAAIISYDLGQPDRAAALWVRLIEDPNFNDSTGRAFLELARARAEARLDGVSSAADSILRENPTSPFLDDALFLAARAAVRKGDHQGALNRYEVLLKGCPASLYCDSAESGIEFIRNFHIRGERLIERMAELSSLPQNRTNPVRWALDWGDFYFDEFKDPVKAADQYDRVLDDILATTEDRLYALRRSGVAYQLLAEAARREKDSFSWTMYSDSAHNRLTALKRLDPYGRQTLELSIRLIEFDASLARSGQASPPIIANRCEEIISKFGEDSLPAATTAIYLESTLASGRIESKNIVSFIAIAERGLKRATNPKTQARLKSWEVEALSSIGDEYSALDTAESVVINYPLTGDGAKLSLLLASSKKVATAKRLEYLARYRELYPYRVDESKISLLEADLLDALNRPIDALTARQKADAASGWGRPELDVLELPPIEIRMERAIAFRRASQFTQAAEELAIVLNSAPEGENAPTALLELAMVEAGRQNPQGALLLLDSLNLRHGDSPATLKSTWFKPTLLMELGDYREAENAYATLATQSDNADSLYTYAVNQILCQYRLDLIENAKKSANELYKRYKDRPDLDQAKALFYLEKGFSLDRSKKFAEARENYDLIRDKFSRTKWADDASYANGQSLIKEGKYEEAVKALDRFITDYADSSLALDGCLSLGLAQYQLERYSEAVVSLKKVWDSRNEARLWQSSFEALSSVYRNLRFFDAAIRLNRDYLLRFPEAPDALDRKMDIAQYYIELKEWDEAIRQYRPLLPFSDAEREAEIQYYLGEASLGKGDYRTAILEFLKVKVLGRKTKLDWGVTAIYQAGFCYEKLGDIEGSSRMYQKIIEETGETSNYGRAARQKLDSLPTAQVPPGTR